MTIANVLLAVGRAFFERHRHAGHGEDERLALLDRDLDAQAQLTELRLMLHDIAAMEAAVEEHERVLMRFAERIPKSAAEALAMQNALAAYATSPSFGQPGTVDLATYEEMVERADEVVAEAKAIEREIAAERERARTEKDDVLRLRAKLTTALHAQRTALRTIRAAARPPAAKGSK